MTPKLTGVDHIHVYVTDRAEAASWYKDVLGFTVVEKFRFWATATGPLTIESASGNIHLALFQRAQFTPSTVLALGASGPEFLEWKTYLEKKGILERCTDHTIMWSLYFKDPYGNSLEITTGDYDQVKKHLG